MLIIFSLIVLSRISSAFTSPVDRQGTYNGLDRLAGAYKALDGRAAAWHSDMEDSDCTVISSLVAIFCAGGIITLDKHFFYISLFFELATEGSLKARLREATTAVDKGKKVTDLFARRVECNI